jgi:hypothetical protein
LVAVVVVVYIISTSLSFKDYNEDMAENGAWYVSFQTRLETASGTLQIAGDSIETTYEKNAEPLDYADWFFGQFAASESSEPQDDSTTVYTVYVKVDTIGRERVWSVLFEKTYAISLEDMSSGTLLTLNKTFGPFIAYNSSLPLKIQYVVEVMDYSGVVETSTGAAYVVQWEK